MIGAVLKPGEICRLLFSALDASSEPITDLVQAGISSVAWEYAVDGVWAAGTSVTLVGSSASAKTTSKLIGQLVEWSPADGVYGIDCPAAAAVDGRTLRLVVTLTNGTAYAAEHVVSEKWSTPANVTAAAAAVQLDATQPNYAVSTFDAASDAVDVGYIEGSDATDYFDVILSDLATLKSRITATLFAGITSLGNWLRLITRSDFTNATATSEIAGTYDASTDSLQAIRDRGDAAWLEGSGGGGSGAHTLTVTVTDGTNPLQNATVRFTEGAFTYTATTDVSGEAVFALDDATYAVAIAKPGYSFTPTTLAVGGDASQSYTMTQITITAPPEPGTATGLLIVRDAAQSPLSDIPIHVQLQTGAGDTNAGNSPGSAVWTEVSDENGLVQFAGLLQGGTYRGWRDCDTANSVVFTVDDEATSFNLPETLGE